MIVIDNQAAQIIEHQLKVSITPWTTLKNDCSDEVRRFRIQKQVERLKFALSEIKGKEVIIQSFAYA